MHQIVKKFGLDKKKLIVLGQSYDGPNSMSGAYRQSNTFISELLGCEIIFVPCYAHRSNKIVQNATHKSLETTTTLFGLCQKRYNFIIGSTKRYAVLCDIYSTSMNEDTLSFKLLSDTRWTEHYNSIIAIL